METLLAVIINRYDYLTVPGSFIVVMADHMRLSARFEGSGVQGW